VKKKPVTESQYYYEEKTRDDDVYDQICCEEDRAVMEALLCCCCHGVGPWEVIPGDRVPLFLVQRNLKWMKWCVPLFDGEAGMGVRGLVREADERLCRRVDNLSV
jgi:hypothetical protein